MIDMISVKSLLILLWSGALASAIITLHSATLCCGLVSLLFATIGLLVTLWIVRIKDEGGES